MIENYTDADIVELVRLEKQATPWPWTWDDENEMVESGFTSVIEAGLDGQLIIADYDLQLVLAARKAVPWLLAERATDKAEIKRLKAVLKGCSRSLFPNN